MLGAAFEDVRVSGSAGVSSHVPDNSNGSRKRKDGGDSGGRNSKKSRGKIESVSPEQPIEVSKKEGLAATEPDSKDPLANINGIERSVFHYPSNPSKYPPRRSRKSRN